MPGSLEQHRDPHEREGERQQTVVEVAQPEAARQAHRHQTDDQAEDEERLHRPGPTRAPHSTMVSRRRPPVRPGFSLLLQPQGSPRCARPGPEVTVGDIPTSRSDGATMKLIPGTPTARLLNAALLLGPLAYLFLDCTYASRGWWDAQTGALHIVAAALYGVTALRLVTLAEGRLQA